MTAETRLWRTQLRAIAVMYDSVLVEVVATGVRVEIPLSKFPLSFLRFHAKVNVGGDCSIVEDLEFD